MIVKGSGKIIANFALQHFKAGIMLHNLAKAIEKDNQGKKFGSFFEDIRSYISSSILSTIAGLEALINELYLSKSTSLHKAVTKACNFDYIFWECNKKIEKEGIINKYKLALKYMGINENLNNWPETKKIQIIIDLRNSLVHFKPNYDKNSREDLEKKLKDKYKLSEFVDTGADFIAMKSMTYNCTAYVLESTKKFLIKWDSFTQINTKKFTQIKQLFNL